MCRLLPHALRLLFLVCVLPLVVSAAPRPILREELQLAVWHDGDRDGLKPIKDILLAAQRARPGLVVTLRVFPSANAHRQVAQWCAPGATNVPDVIILRDIWLPDFACSLQPLNALLPARDLRHIPDSIKRRLRHAGNLYGVPWLVEARALFYRPEALKAAGVLPPRTWEEALIAARRCHNPPTMYGFGLPGIRDDGAAELLLQMLWAQGADLPPVGDAAALPADRLTAALKLYDDLHEAAEPEVLSWDALALEDFFVAGRLAMVIAPKSFQDYIVANAPDLDYATVPLPAGCGPVGHIGLELACVFKGTSHRDAAVRLLRTLTTVEGCAALMKMGSIPFRKDVAAKHRLDPTYAAYIATLDHARGLPARRWASACPILSDGLFYLLTGRRTVEQAAEMILTRFAEGEPLEVTGDR